MRVRSLVVVGSVAGMLAAGVLPASAQGDPVGGSGNHFFLAGAGNVSGRASIDFYYGNADDDVYFGDFVDQVGSFGGDGRDDAMVRRGNSFIIRGQNGRVFRYGNVGDEVLVGDWDGDGSDSLAVRRGNRFFVKNDVDSGPADYTFDYGDAGDVVLVGNWDGDTSAPEDQYAETTDTIMVRRGDRYFVKNDTESGFADYDFVFGNPDDQVLVGDWATAPRYGDDPATPARETNAVLFEGEDGDYADQLAVRRGNVYFQSTEVSEAEEAGLATDMSFAYGNVTDTAFTAQLEVFSYTSNYPIGVYGDGLAVRRNG